jgi:hypothetical protein
MHRLLATSVPVPSRRVRFIARTALALLLVAVLFSSFPVSGPAAGPPVYPDLQTLNPDGLYIERGSDGRFRLRFDNTVGNYGGRLELTVDGDRNIYQNVYDQLTGGSRALQQRVSSDLIFHPEHNHFHFKDFARYELLKQDRAGVYRATTRRGSKTSFCILDYERMTSNGPSSAQYSTCGSTIQGLSAGWGDTYYASLPEQWIDLGTATMTDGAYALRSTADPYNKILESNNGNNVGITYFSVRNGMLSLTGTPVLCTSSPDRGPVGTVAQLRCTGFNAGESVDIYWGSTSTAPKTTVTAGSTGNVAETVTIPSSDIGNHYIIGRGRGSGKQGAALFNTQPSATMVQASGVVGSTVQVSLLGFSSGGSIEVRYFTTSSSSVRVATVSASSNGSATASFTVPTSVYGSHKVEAFEQASSSRVSGTFSVSPSAALVPGTTQAGSTFGLSLRGYASREGVNVTLNPGGSLLRTVTASSSGSTTAGSTQITVPATTAPGTYSIVATGAVSGARSSATLIVTAPTVASESPTAPATATAIATATASVTATATDDSSQVADAGEDISEVDSDGDGEVTVVLDGRDSYDPDGRIASVTWMIGDQLLSTDLVDPVTLPVGIHAVTLTVADRDGATATDDVLITIEGTGQQETSSAGESPVEPTDTTETE